MWWRDSFRASGAGASSPSRARDHRVDDSAPLLADANAPSQDPVEVGEAAPPSVLTQSPPRELRPRGTTNPPAHRSRSTSAVWPASPSALTQSPPLSSGRRGTPPIRPPSSSATRRGINSFPRHADANAPAQVQSLCGKGNLPRPRTVRSLIARSKHRTGHGAVPPLPAFKPPCHAGAACAAHPSSQLHRRSSYRALYTFPHKSAPQAPPNCTTLFQAPPPARRPAPPVCADAKRPRSSSIPLR